jgi:two-component system, NarL family, response regulator DesR
VIRILVIKDAAGAGSAVRLSESLHGYENMFVIGRIDVDDAKTVVESYRPDVVLLCGGYMVSQILAVVAELKSRMPRCGFLMLSDPEKRGMLPPRRRARELSFALHDTPIPLLARVIARVAAGERVVDPRLQLLSIQTEKAVNTVEWQVLGLAAQGDTVEEISHRLHLSTGTVRNYLSAVIAKTGARNRLDAIRIARKSGWLG